MRKYFLVIATMIVLVAGTLPASADYVPGPIVFHNYMLWRAAVCDYFERENFTDATLNPGLSVTTDLGYVDLINHVWWDRLTDADPVLGDTKTIWHFAQPIFAFGGFWDMTPGGPGSNIEVSINGSWIVIDEIPNTYTGQFWGFVSNIPFTDIRLRHGSSPAIAETYTLDNMVYNELRNYVTGGGKLGGKKPYLTFGGNVGIAPNGEPFGQFQLNDHSHGVAYHTTNIEALEFYGPDATSPPASNNTAKFRAEFRGNDGSERTFVITLWDLNESREKFDSIKIELPNGTVLLPRTRIDGGNIQVHDEGFVYFCFFDFTQVE